MREWPENIARFFGVSTPNRVDGSARSPRFTRFCDDVDRLASQKKRTIRSLRPMKSLKHQSETSMNDIFLGALSLIWPGQCPGCDASIEPPGFCGTCQLSLSVRAGPQCSVCDRSFAADGPRHRCGRCLDRRPRFDRAWGLFDYTGPVGEALRRGKYGRRPELIEYIGELVGVHVPIPLLEDPPHAVVALPLHRRRLHRRGFSVPELLAWYTARSLGVQRVRSGLRRIRDTPPQAGLDDVARRRNVRDAFLARNALPADLVLVDDVFTTGATVDAATLALRKAGVERVRVVCAAYVDLD